MALAEAVLQAAQRRDRIVQDLPREAGNGVVGPVQGMPGPAGLPALGMLKAIQQTGTVIQSRAIPEFRRL